MSRTTPRLEWTLHLIREERNRHVLLHGNNDDTPMGFGRMVCQQTPSPDPAGEPWLSPLHSAGAEEVQRLFRQDYEQYVLTHGGPTWMHLIREEVAELFDAQDREDIIAEATQVAALCASLVEHLLETVPDPKHRAASVSDQNRRLIQKAYEDTGEEGRGVSLVAGENGWFSGLYEGAELFQALEHQGTLYSIVHASGGGLVSVITGKELIEDELGPTFPSIDEAKTYVEGLVAK